MVVIVIVLVIVMVIVIIVVVVVVIDLEGFLMVERGDAGDVSCRDRHRSRDSRQTGKTILVL